MNFEGIWLGETSYQEGQRVQKECLQKAQIDGKGFVLGFEFPTVVTLGRRGDRQSDVLPSTSEMENLGIDIVNVDRGGHATLHNPGQLVIYPVLPLRKMKLRPVSFVELLQETTEKMFELLGVRCHRKESPGIYTEKGKIAFFGLRIEQGVSQHGLSINVCNRLSEFKYIRSCGQKEESFDRLADYLKSPILEELFASWYRLFLSEFKDKTKEKSEQQSTVKHFEMDLKPQQ